MSNTAIANFALSIVGAEPLTDYDHDTSKAARHVRIQLPRLRDVLNATYRWNFAMKRVALGGAVVPAPAWEYTNAFALPTDLLRLWETDIVHPTDWRVEGHQLVTDASSVSILYSRAVVEVDEFTEGYRATLETLLAANLALPILREPRVRRDLLLEARDLLFDALATESHENKPYQINTDSLVEARVTAPFITLDVT